MTHSYQSQIDIDRMSDDQFNGNCLNESFVSKLAVFALSLKLRHFAKHRNEFGFSTR